MSSIDEVIRAIHENKPRKIVVMTGAGVSADSGIPTFRGAGGLWRNFRAEDLATPEAFRRDPQTVWEWYEWRRGLIREAKPNAAHEALARLHDAVVVTQNVDGLHTRAGSRDVVELHGNIFRVSCVREGKPRMHEEPFDDVPPRCECGALLRPGVVWFGEALPPDAVERAVGAIHNADLLLVIGTSGVVYPAAGFVSLHDGLSIEINPETSGVSSSCTYAIPARAAEATPAIVEAIMEVSA
ncbi:MAG TPA: NAD-dependent deacylase [Thermoanaerobaculia bacterium]|nr:NAD-dependent deacylase [Thermoanaerobaculia bacterium]